MITKKGLFEIAFSVQYYWLLVKHAMLESANHRMLCAKQLGYHAIKLKDQTKPPKVTGTKKLKYTTIAQDRWIDRLLKPIYSKRKQMLKR